MDYYKDISDQSQLRVCKSDNQYIDDIIDTEGKVKPGGCFDSSNYLKNYNFSDYKNYKADDYYAYINRVLSSKYSFTMILISFYRIAIGYESYDHMHMHGSMRHTTNYNRLL